MENLLPYLVVLACPASMGLMMWLMMRGQKNPDSETHTRELEERVRELEVSVPVKTQRTRQEASSPEHAA